MALLSSLSWFSPRSLLLLLLLTLSEVVLGGAILLPRGVDYNGNGRGVQTFQPRPQYAQGRQYAAQNIPFRGEGYLSVWTGRGPGFLAPVGVGYRRVGWLNQNAEWVQDLKARAVFKAVDSPVQDQSIILLSSPAGGCFIWRKNGRLDCTAITDRYDVEIPKLRPIRVQGNRLLQEFNAAAKPGEEGEKAKVLLAVEGWQFKGNRAVVQWEPF